MSRSTYLVRAERSGNWWAIEAPEVDGAFSQAKRIDQIEDMAREVVALMLNVPEDSFDLKLDVAIPAEWDALAKLNRKAQIVAEVAQRVASSHARDTVQQLQAAGLPLRDIGSIMGISAQRVSQLLHPSRSRQV
jgi:DNA-directed RNA polymerase specialized sigma24 family protein